MNPGPSARETDLLEYGSGELSFSSSPKATAPNNNFRYPAIFQDPDFRLFGFFTTTVVSLVQF